MHDFHGEWETAGRWSVVMKNSDGGGSSTLPLVTAQLTSSISVGSA